MYERKGSEGVQDWKCPACGVAYQKIEQIKQRQKEDDVRFYKEQKDRDERLKQLNSWGNLLFVAFLVSMVGIASTESEIGCGFWSFCLGVLSALYTRRINKVGMLFGGSGWGYIKREESPIHFKIQLTISALSSMLLFLNSVLVFYGMGLCCA